jgi:type 2 lantibiotic biosynthesis protein LanM
MAVTAADLGFKHDDTVAFAQALEPWRDLGHRLLQQGGFRNRTFSESAMEQLDSHLLERLSFVAGRALHSLFEEDCRDRARSAATTTYRTWVRSFLGGGASPLLARFPFAARLMSAVTENWASALLALEQRVRSDGEVLRERLSWGGATHRVESVSRPLGDSHNGGRQVYWLEDAEGHRVVYKPRSVAPESAFNDVLGWCNATSDSPPLKVAAVVARDGYGWMEYVEAAECESDEEVRSFYHRAGRLLRLLQLVGGTDLHVENVIAARDHPVAVDLECIMQPRIHLDRPPPVRWAWEVLRDSVLSTGLMPGALPERSALLVDLSGFGGTRKQQTGRTTSRWAGLGTDDIRLVEGLVTTPAADNRPTHDKGARVDVTAMIQGVSAVDRRFRESAPPLDGFHALVPRVVLRSTAFYSSLLSGAVRPDNLTDGVRFDIEIDALAKWALDRQEESSEDEGNDQWMWSVVAAERAALVQLDVPWFTVDATSGDMHLDGGGVESKVYAATGSDGLRRRIAAMSETESQLQADLIRIAFEGYGAGKAHTNGFVAPEPTQRSLWERALGTARSIGDHVLDRRLEVTDGLVRWLEVVPRGRTASWQPSLDSGGLYIGASGTALFLAALARADDDARLRDLGRAAIATDELRGVDSADQTLTTWELTGGVAGRAYAAAVVGELSGDDDLMAAGRTALAALGAPTVQPGDKLDVVGGWAGVVLAQLAVGGRLGDDQILESARGLARDIRRAWEHREATAVHLGHRRLGFAHGGTGILFAAAKAAHHHDDHALHSWVEDRLEVENDRISRRSIPSRLRHVGDARVAEPGWCWGTAGFVLARTRLQNWVDPSLASRWLDAGIEFTAANPGANHRLCCGMSGQVEALLVSANGHRDQVPDALVSALTGIDGPFILEPQLTFLSPSLFRGLGGIGYTLVRYAQPNLPSVLLVE